MALVDVCERKSAYEVEAWLPLHGTVADPYNAIGALAQCAVSPRLAAQVPAVLVPPSASDVVGVARSYEDLVDACRTRRQELKLPQLLVDEIAGLASGYVGKIECGDKRLGAMSLPCLLGALGLELVVVRAVPHHLRHEKRKAA